MFGGDSVDEFVEDARLVQKDIYRELSSSISSPEQFWAAIPNIRPVEGWITRKFFISPDGAKQSHRGIDFAASKGTLIRATAPGYVMKIQDDNFFGLVVTIEHSYGFQTRYGHCSQILVSEGDRVKRGQTIALVGNTGRSSAPHLHYEVIKEGNPVDPLNYILDGVSANL
jgi:murein DD-endopeptidase MepM/ murein hydrolase activator NlpD